MLVCMCSVFDAVLFMLSWWLRSPGHKSVAAGLLGLRVLLLLGVFYVCWVLFRSGFCSKLIARSEASYRVCMHIILCYLETSVMRWPRCELGCCITEEKI
jgi:hypothetical protein